ncbi:MAG TPA: GerMN domain-containing protein [bacterium]|nr:GerMN domain-containing protein [bacterium]HOL48231.1 GerMN domain-containing protein [bacterium]HPQ19751.1 GerMN domain-containing protein [bacterium]
MKKKIIFILIIIIFFGIVIWRIIYVKKFTTELKSDEHLLKVEEGEKVVILYFPDNNYETLIKKKHKIISDGNIFNDIKQIFDLLKLSKVNFNLDSLIPEETIILSSFITNNTLYLNISKDILGTRGATEEYLLLQEIVLTFIDSFPSYIKRVQLLVDNKIVKTLGLTEETGHIDISKTFSKDCF